MSHEYHDHSRRGKTHSNGKAGHLHRLEDPAPPGGNSVVGLFCLGPEPPQQPSPGKGFAGASARARPFSDTDHHVIVLGMRRISLLSSICSKYAASVHDLRRAYHLKDSSLSCREKNAGIAHKLQEASVDRQLPSVDRQPSSGNRRR
mmetsp:Transcript_25610/g.42768  ORF Transcript_25610/g.42768 Transcript_25610/m.42768 type:complete len:147 (-) Transcript_25610:1146-1586(-)